VWERRSHARNKGRGGKPLPCCGTYHLILIVEELKCDYISNYFVPVLISVVNIIAFTVRIRREIDFNLDARD